MAQSKNQVVRKLTGSIRGRLLTAFVGLIFLVSVLIISISTIIGFRAGREQVLDQLEASATLKEAEINTWLAGVETSFSLLANESETDRLIRVLLGPTSFREANKKLLSETFDRFLAVSGQFDNLYLLDDSGTVVVSSDITAGEVDYSDQRVFIERQDSVHVHPLLYEADQNRSTLYVTIPIYHESGTFLGVLAGRINLDPLNNIVTERTGFGTSGETYLVDANRILVSESRFDEYTPGDTQVATEGVQVALQQRQDGTGLYDDYRGVPVVGAYHWLPELQSILLSEQDQGEAFQSIYTEVAVNIGVGVMAMILAITLALIVTRSISGPLAELTKTATKIANGDLSLRARVKREDEVGYLAQAFNQMTDRLRQTINTLELRVKDRTQALEISNEISRQITAILDLEELLQYVVNRVRNEFNFYHTHIYLVDEATGDLVLSEGYGEVGRLLKEQNHRLQAGTGIVGKVASSNQHFLSNDVDTVAQFVRNKLLPETQSELALPLRKGNTVLGVLDIQSDRKNRFTADDVSLMQSIANQTAVAVDNIRLIEDTQRALQQVRRLNSRLTRESWQEFNRELQHTGYRYLGREQGASIVPDSTAWLKPMEQASKHKQMVKQIHPSNGETGHSELAVPLKLRGEVIGVLGVKRDTADGWADEELSAVEAVADQVSRALENARLSKEQEKTIEQLKEIDRLKSEFLTSMSHELRTPLNSIIGFADVLLQGIDGDLPDMALGDIRLIHSSGQHLLALINDILDLSKIEAGKMELVREPIAMESVIQEVLAASASLIKDKPVELIVEKPDNLPEVYADKLRLRQILLNLVSNAAKFTDEGSITIRSRIDEDSPDRLCLSVIDTGIGIPQDKLEQIFDRFQQADGTTTRKYGGTGLGLAISVNLAEMHGGELKVKSEVGVGSEFYFTIPLADSSEPESELN